MPAARSDGLSTPEPVKQEPSTVAPPELAQDPLAQDPLLDTRLRKLLELIETAPLSSVNDWALAFNVSNAHLQRLFRQATGVGLSRALSEKRLLRAARLLSETNMSVKEIACSVGYEHTSSFTRAFEKRFQQAPSDYRRQNAA